MKSRRRTSIILLMATSVFLCLLMSCGIPTPLVPTIDFTKGSTTSSSSTFSVSYKGDAVGDYGKVGLIILYYPYESSSVDSQDDSKIRSTFSSKYRVSNIDGVFIDVTEGSPLYEITDSQKETAYVYAFEIEGKAVESPTYTLALSTTGDFISSITINYDSETNCFELQLDDSLPPINLTLDDDISLSETPYLHLYAALTAQSSQYSNLFWSELKCVGGINTHPTT